MSREQDLPVPATCEQHRILMMGHLDRELTTEQELQLQSHLRDCAACSVELVRFQKLEDLAHAVQLREPQDYEWERFQRVLYNRMERRTGLWLLAGGMVLGVCAVVVEVARSDALSPWLKAAIAAMGAGFLLLFLNVLRGRLRTLPYDRYREVQR